MKPFDPYQTRSPQLEPPVRLLAGGGSAFERQLVESARGDRMPAASLEQLARALRVPGAALPAKSFAEVIRASQLARLGSLAGVGGLGLVAALALRSPAPTAFERTQPPASESAPRAVNLSVEVSPAATTSGGERSLPLIAASTPGVSVPPPQSAAPRAVSKPDGSARSRPLPARAEPAASTMVPTPIPNASGLRAELLALEAVQHALRDGRAEEANSALVAYTRRFPRAELSLEAELLGIDVLLARGESDRARAKARELLARPDAVRYRERLKALGENGALGSERASSPHQGAEVIQ